MRNIQIKITRTLFIWVWNMVSYLNPINAKLNPICYLLALLGAHHILYVSRVRVNSCNSGCCPLQDYFYSRLI